MRYPHSTTIALLAAAALWLAACAGPADEAPAPGAAAPDAGGEAPRVAWALAIHGGAGTIPKTLPEEQQRAYFATLEQALTLGRDALARGDASLEVVEQVVRLLEDSPLFNAGKGAVFTHDGRHELDAAIMDGRDLGCGAVAGVRTVKNPISLARRVMTETPHVLLIGEGAEAFAAQMGVERVDPSYFDTDRRRQQLQEALTEETEEGSGAPDAAEGAPEAGEESAAEPGDDGKHGTVGAVALDRDGNLAAATSTGGLTNKRFGRVGDVPIIGAGTYANNRTAAISCTGKGEEFIRHSVAYDVSALMKYRGLSLQAAAETVILQKLQPGDGGLVAVGRDGSIALVFNSEGMFRGAADANGRFEVKIWE